MPRGHWGFEPDKFDPNLTPIGDWDLWRNRGGGDGGVWGKNLVQKEIISVHGFQNRILCAIVTVNYYSEVCLLEGYPSILLAALTGSGSVRRDFPRGGNAYERY